MTEQEAKEQYRRLFAAFPSVPEWVNRNADDPATTYAVWRQMLGNCDLGDVAAVIDDMIAGRIEAIGRYDRMDCLPGRIRQAAKDRRYKRTSRNEIADKYLNQSRGSWDTVKRDPTGHIAVMLGTMVREKKITRRENALRMEELLEWSRGKSGPPEWFAEMGLAKHAIRDHRGDEQ